MNKGKEQSLRKLSRVTNKLWGKVAQEKATSNSWKGLSWDAHPVILQYINRRISGNPNESWLPFLKRTLFPRLFEYGLSLGCGWGALERDAIHLGICRYFDAYDMSKDAIEVAESEALKNALEKHIVYYCDDLNTVTFETGKYDICFGAAAIHHVNNLEHLFSQITEALRPGAYLVLNEYVGPARFQWNNEIEQLMNKLLAIIPDSLKTSLRNGIIKGEVRRPNPTDVIKTDPSEAVRSDEILWLFEKYFQTIYRANFGGTLLQFVLADIVGNFREDDLKDKTILNLLALFEETLIDMKVIPNDFVLLVGKKHMI